MLTQVSYRYRVSKLARFNLFRSYRNRMTSVGLLESWSPWPSRSSTPKPGQPKDDGPGTLPSNLQQGNDRTMRSRFRFSLHHYPPDCPPAQIKWYYAVDVGIDIQSDESSYPFRNLM